MKNKTTAERLMEKNAELIEANNSIKELHAQLLEANATITKLKIALTSPTIEEAQKVLSELDEFDASKGHITIFVGEEGSKTYTRGAVSLFDLIPALDGIANQVGWTVAPTFMVSMLEQLTNSQAPQQ